MIITEKGNPRKRSVFGGLASPARFERAASRLGALIFAMINKPRLHLQKSKKPSNLGIFWLCSFCIFDFFKSFRVTFRGCLRSKMQSKCCICNANRDPVQSKCSQKCSLVCSHFKAVRNRYRVIHSSHKVKPADGPGSALSWRILSPPLATLVSSYRIRMTYQCRTLACILLWWAGMDSNHRSLTAADLQSAPFSLLGTCPCIGDPPKT